MDLMSLVKLRPLMEESTGDPSISIGLIDGPVFSDHQNLTSGSVKEIPGARHAACSHRQSAACQHGTFVAGMLSARRSSATPGICPDCTLFVRNIFGESDEAHVDMPSTTPEELAQAVKDCVDAGARILNVSAALARPSSRGEPALEHSLTYAAQRGVIVVAACGNQGTVGSSAITRHPWVIPVAACDDRGRPLRISNLGPSVGRRGLRAPGQNVTSLGTETNTLTLTGTSAAAPFVTGTIALMWSAFRKASASQMRLAVLQAFAARPRSIVPPLLDASASYQYVARSIRAC
jgi:subtilisin family serine protease